MTFSDRVPGASAVLATVRVAVPAEVSVAELSVVEPASSVTVPVGLAAPEAAFTVTFTAAAVP